MLSHYTSGEPVAITLPGDTKNPTIFYILPMNARVTAKWHALQNLAAKKATEAMEEETVDSEVAAADARITQQLTFMTTRIIRIENAPPDGGTLTKHGKIEAFLEDLVFDQHNSLIMALMDQTQLDQLKFRVDSLPGGEGGEPESSEADAGAGGEEPENPLIGTEVSEGV